MQSMRLGKFHFQPECSCIREINQKLVFQGSHHRTFMLYNTTNEQLKTNHGKTELDLFIITVC
jgi:hypothetical protein